MARHLRKLAHIFLSECLSNDVGFFLIGLINRFFLRGRLNTVFLYYPANRRYMQHVIYPWYAPRVKWRPILIGAFFHGQGGGIICGIAATEKDFVRSENAEKMHQVHARMQRIAKLVGAKSDSYAGVLPSALLRSGVSRQSLESERTVHWVMEAMESIRQQYHMPQDSPIVVIGAAGFVGTKLVKRLREHTHAEVVEIDPIHRDEQCRTAQAMEHLRGRKAFVLNVSRNHVIKEYAPHMWAGLVILNDVYPECDHETLALLKAEGVKYFHLQGVVGKSIPRFPEAYAGAIPCCAASAVEAVSAGVAAKSRVAILEK